MKQMGPNLFSMSSIDLYIPNARSDNAIAYLGTIGNVTVGATYSLGRDASTAGGPAGTSCAGEAAVDYLWVNPATQALEPKTSYIERIDEATWLGVGIYRKQMVRRPCRRGAGLARRRSRPYRIQTMRCRSRTDRCAC